jgi:hypothetical protein
MGLMGCRVNMSKLLLLTVCAFGLLFSSALAQAQCTYRMNDVGRFRGYLSGPCNGHALGYAGHSQLALIQPRKPTQPETRRSPTTVTGFAKGSAKRLGRQVDSQILRPATRNGLGLIVWGLLASARQQIAQGWQGSPGRKVARGKPFVKREAPHEFLMVRFPYE